jgi:glycosyltransferase involved in cell wall biosynthesis
VRVAMVSPFPDYPGCVVGGVAGVATYLAEELVKRPEIELTLVVPQGAKGSETTYERWGRAGVYRLGRAGMRGMLPGTLYDVAAGKRQLAALLGALEPDIVHFQGMAFLAEGCALPSVLTLHGLAEKDAALERTWGAAQWLKRRVLKATEEHGRRASRRVILISDSVASVLPDDARRKIWRIDNPVDEAFFAAPRAPEPGRVLCCSRVRPLKNILGLLDAFALAARSAPGLTLRVAGAADPGHLRACQRRAAELGLGARARFLGPLGIEDVRRELSRAACLALVSFQENSPLCVAEAMAAGVPVVASSVGGLPEMVEEGGSGLLVNPRDAGGIAEGLLRVVGDPALARAMGERGRELARRRYRASDVAARTLDVYREILEERA